MEEKELGIFGTIILWIVIVVVCFLAVIGIRSCCFAATNKLERDLNKLSRTRAGKKVGETAKKAVDKLSYWLSEPNE